MLLLMQNIYASRIDILLFLEQVGESANFNSRNELSE